MRDRYRALSPPHSPPRRSSRDDVHCQLEESWRPSHSHRSSIQHQPKRDWSKPIGSPNHRYRTWSSPPPPPPTVPGRDAIEPLTRRYPASLRPETDRFVGTGSVRRREFDEPKSVNVRELPEYGESLPRNESAFTKFHLHSQLPNSRAPISNANPTRDERNVILGSSSSPFNEYRNEDFASRKFGGVGLFSDSPGVVPTSMSMEKNERYQMDSTRRITTTSYGLVQPRTTNSLGSAVGMIEGKDDPQFMGSVKQSGTVRILEDYNFLKERYINTHLAERGGEVEENLKDGGGDGVLYGRREVGMEPLDRGELRWVEYGSKRCISGGIGSSGDGLRRMPISYEGLCGAESSPQRHFLEGDLDMDDPEEMMLKRRRFDMEPTQHSQKRRFYNWNATDNEFYDTVNGTGQWSDEDTETLPLYQDSVTGQSYDRIASMTNNEMIIHGNSYLDIPLSNIYIPESKKNHVRKFVKTSKRDIKSRLEFPGNVKQRLGIPKEMLMRQPVKAYKCNIKQRLGPAPCSRNSSRPAGKNHRELPWVKIQEGRCLEYLGGPICLQGVKSSEVNATKNKNNKKLMKAEPPEDFESEEKISLKTELPEDSVEFMQLIQSAHLKYVKVLNENSAIRRKYTEQGGRGPFKCSICGSSKEFVDTLSLAQHAFTSCKGGTRSEHLGFHKALCVLMGWTSADVPSSPWVRQIMPDTQALSLKEDLIIWPPIVIVHNISIARENPDERMIVSIEGLWDILRGMGFGQLMINVCRGKAANQSTMVVAFKGTFSGLREAQRLHRFYSENKCGRLEFEQIVSGSANESKAETQGVPADSAESVLYGYMGIASDLVKVDFETKKRSVVKSKKGIEAIADASLA